MQEVGETSDFFAILKTRADHYNLFGSMFLEITSLIISKALNIVSIGGRGSSKEWEVGTVDYRHLHVGDMDGIWL